MNQNKGDDFLEEEQKDHSQETVDQQETPESEVGTAASEVEEPIESTDEETINVSPEEALQSEITRLNDQVYRLSAEISNIQKRNAKERQDAAKYRSQPLAQQLLAVVDNLERALATPVDQEQAVALKKGVEMAHEAFLHALKEEGIEAIEDVNVPFDPMKHHAVQVVEAEEGQAPDTVVQVFQKGYQLKDRVIRPAMVIVSQ